MPLASKSFSTKAQMWGTALFSTIFMAANAHAADAKIVQVADLDLNQPIPSNVCVKDDAQGAALSKMRTIMDARGQKSVIAGNQTVADIDPEQGGSRELMFTSNLQNGGEGYVVGSNRPMGRAGTTYCFAQNKQVFIYSVFNSKGIPANANKGELGIALTNNDKVGLKVAMVAVTQDGALSVVNFDPNTGRGSEKVANGLGYKAADIALLTGVGYSASLPLAFKKALGIPDESVSK